MIDLWLGDNANAGGKSKGAPKTGTTPPEEEGNDDPDAAAEAAAGTNAEDGAGDGEGETNDDDPNKVSAEHGDPTKGAKQLDGLIQAVLADSTEDGQINTDSAAYKRMVKMLGEPAALKQQLTDVQAQLADKEVPVVVQKATASNPLAEVFTQSDLEKMATDASAQVSRADRWIDWCTDNRQGGTPTGAKEELTAEQVGQYLTSARSAKRNAEAVLKMVPAREKYLQDYAASRAELRKSRPELFQKGNTELQEASKLIAEGIISVSSPTHMQDALDLIEGRRARQERLEGIVKVTLDTKAATTAKPKAGASTTTARTTATPGAGTTSTPARRPAGSSGKFDLKATKEAADRGDPKALGSLIDAFAA